MACSRWIDDGTSASSTMPVWSSPFPCAPLPELEHVDFPGPAGSLLVYDSPDRILLRWRQRVAVMGANWTS